MITTDRPALTDVEITPEMIEAAVDAYLLVKREDWDESLDHARQTVRAVLQAALTTHQ